MKIKTQFLITMFLFGLVLLITAASIVITNLQVERLQRQLAIAQAVERGARDLGYLSNDYLLFGESQQRTRWEEAFAAFSRQVARLDPATLDQQALVINIRANQARLQATFADAVSTIERTAAAPGEASSAADLDFIRISSSRMAVQNQGIIFDAAQLAQQLNAQVNRVRQANMVVIFILLGTFAAYFITNYVLVYRHTLRSIAVLQEGIRVIGSGKLDFVLPEGRADEIGALAQAFNHMTDNLNAVTASRADLEREIAARQQIDQERERLLGRLVQSNQELQQFAFVASHDLQEPLRKIVSFSQLISERSHLDEPERDYLSRVQNAAQRMQRMINDLLELSRITTHKQPCERVDLNLVANQVVDDLEERIQRSHGQVMLRPLPVLEADAVQMHQLLQNLVGNALKFRRLDTPPVVEVGYRDVLPGKVEIYVRDNGIGFDMRFVEQIFLPFKRLHGRSEYEGSGIGLAVCQKIAERHGGQIEAHSAPGEGATFSVVLPRKQNGG